MKKEANRKEEWRLRRATRLGRESIDVSSFEGGLVQLAVSLTLRNSSAAINFHSMFNSIELKSWNSIDTLLGSKHGILYVFQFLKWAMEDFEVFLD